MRLLNTARFLLTFATAATILSLLLVRGASAAPSLPPGYVLTPVASGLNYPTNLAWLPDGTMLIAEKGGVVKRVKNGVSSLLADISATTNDYWDHGVIGIAVDPAYVNNRFIYLTRTYENNAANYIGTKSGQLVRITVNSAGTGMVAGSLTVLLGKATPASCEDLAATADCLPADSPSHTVGDIVFGADGTLYVANGDGAAFSFTDPLSLRSQNIDSLSGKLLHVDRNGRGLPANPFYTGNAADNRSKVLAYGLRNPWRFTFKPGTNTLYVIDVGSDAFEEVNVVSPGANFGWPCYEGDGQRDLPEIHAGCAPLYTKVGQGAARIKMPLTAWIHENGGGAGVGGAFVTGPGYPASLQGAYLYGDYVHQYLRTLRTDTNHQLTAGPADFATGILGDVDIEQGPDGKIYIVTIADATNNPGTGRVLRLDYAAAPAACADGQFKADYFNGIALAGAPVFTACEAAPLNQNWGFASPGPGVSADNFSVRWTGSFDFADGNYRFDAVADDGVRVFVDGAKIVDGWKDQSETAYQGQIHLAAGRHAVAIEYYDSGEEAVLRASWQALGGNVAPVATITRPADNILVPIGATVAFDGFATDLEDGRILDATLQWNAVVQHCANGVCHSHFLERFTGSGGAFSYPAHGVDDYYVELSLTAVDSGGLQGTKTIRINPDRGDGACPAGQFKGEYFNNKTLAGAPAATTCMAGIDINLPVAAPSPGISADNFSARYTSIQVFDAGAYTFSLTGDDGVRLYLDGILLIDGWRDQAATTYNAVKALAAGKHDVKVEYYDATEDAVVKLVWSKQ